MADLRPYDPKFLNFMRFFGKFWQTHSLAPPLGGLVPLLRGILDPPLTAILTSYQKEQINIWESPSLFVCFKNATHTFAIDALTDRPIILRKHLSPLSTQTQTIAGGAMHVGLFRTWFLLYACALNVPSLLLRSFSCCRSQWRPYPKVFFDTFLFKETELAGIK